AARLAETDPEGALLYRLYRKLDVRPSSYWREDAPAAAGPDLSLLHDAIRDSRPVAFGYTDLSDNESVRTVLPLALVHPPQGVKLLAYCEERQGYRQFFVRAMRDVTVQAGDFADERMALLEGLVEKEGA
ncbi:WYL domain-containing protein, partial [Albidovulum sp.]|uniref:WYL domain-containing protein n=1 Tax=Albidovulum sp. TaxID=1872424 RepID=UPI0039B9BED8